MTEPTHNPNIDERINPPEVPDAPTEVPNAPSTGTPDGPDINVPNPDAPERANPDVHEGAKDDQVSDRVGPGAGYDQEPEKTKDKGGVS